MKKGKKLIAVILCIATLMSLAVTSAFAANDSVDWVFNPDTDYRLIETYHYAGEISVGENIVSPIIVDGNYVENGYYILDVDKPGYYAVTTVQKSGDFLSGGYVAEASDSGTVYDTMSAFFIDSEKYDEETAHVYYLEEKQYFISSDWWYDEEINGNSKGIIDISYFAEEISEVEIIEASTQSLIYGDDIDTYALENGKRVGTQFGYTVTFSNGKRHEEDYAYTKIRFNNKPVSGENDVTLLFPGYEKDITITAYYIDDLIESVTLSKLERHTVLNKDYSGKVYRTYASTTDETEIITFELTDGTTKKFELPLGENDYLNVFNDYRSCFFSKDYIDHPDGSYTFEVCIAGKEYISIPCVIKEYNFKENLNALKHNLSDEVSFLISRSNIYFKCAFDFESYTADEQASYFIMGLNSIRYVSDAVLNHLNLFIKNCI